jgi:deazaflavin-dependent oxidoreductase (nitroreductase family)
VILIASNYGQAHHPAWYHNLRAHPRARIAVRGEPRDVTAEQVESPERERYIAIAAVAYPGYRRYERRAAPRRIAVFRLT